MTATGERDVQPGVDHLIPANVPWDHMRYAAEKLREVCSETKGG